MIESPLNYTGGKYKLLDQLLSHFPKNINNFYDIIMKNGVKATIRQKHGDDIDAACGQLRAKKEAEK